MSVIFAWGCLWYFQGMSVIFAGDADINCPCRGHLYLPMQKESALDPAVLLYPGRHLHMYPEEELTHMDTPATHLEWHGAMAMGTTCTLCNMHVRKTPETSLKKSPS